MNQQPMGIRLALTQKPGFPANVVQVLHTRPGQSGPAVFQPKAPHYGTVPVLTSPSLQINTNTAAQYVRKPQEMTLVGPNGAFMAGSITAQPMGQVVNLGQANVADMSQAMMRQQGGGMTTAPGPNSSASLSNLTNSRKPCNCTKSHCLKLYCECFAQGQLCQNCNCNNCMNNLAYEEERGRAIKMTLERNPTAFHPKIGRGEGERKHTKGCNCKRSGCLKNYCECYEAKISCSDLCRCLGCRNTEDSIERRSLMRLAAMGSLRSRQPNAFRKHLVKPPSETLPHVFFTWETIEATASCLLAQAEDAERRDLPAASQERIILEEFGRTMDRVIEVTKKAQIRTGATSLVTVGGQGVIPDDMTMGSTRIPLAIASSAGPASPHGHHRSRAGASSRHAPVHGDDEEEEGLVGPDDFHTSGDHGDYGDDAGHFGDEEDDDEEEEEEEEEEDDEDVDDDLDLLDRHSRQRRGGSGPSTSSNAPTAAASSSGKMPSVKFISRGGSGTKPYVSRKGY